MNSNLETYYRSLTRNIIGTIIVVSIIPMVLVSSTIYLQFRASYQAKVRDHLRELVQKHKQNIDGFLTERLSNIQTMATIHGYDKLSDQSNLEYLLEVYQHDTSHAFVDLGVINAAGKQVAYAGPFKLAKAEYADAAWFRMAMQRQFVISYVFKKMLLSSS